MGIWAEAMAHASASFLSLMRIDASILPSARSHASLERGAVSSSSFGHHSHTHISPRASHHRLLHAATLPAHAAPARTALLPRRSFISLLSMAEPQARRAFAGAWQHGARLFTTLLRHSMLSGDTGDGDAADAAVTHKQT